MIEEIIKITRCAAPMALLASATAAQADEALQPTLISTLEENRNLFLCIDVASRSDRTDLQSCLTDAAITNLRTVTDPIEADEFIPEIVGFWIMRDRSDSQDITSEQFSSMLDYAGCMEAAALAHPAISSGDLAGLRSASSAAKVTCSDHPMSAFDSLGEPKSEGPPSFLQLMTARFVTETLNYALESRGWYPNELRTCVVGQVGEPSSRGCEGRGNVPALIVPPPAPSASPPRTSGQ